MKNSQQNYTTLVVDDDMLIQQILAKILADVCRVVEITNGASAIEAYKEHKPDVVFLDINMPDVNGLDLIKEIKDINKDAYIIMITSSSTEENIKRAIKEKASDFIVKPFDAKTVLEKFYCCPAVGTH